MGLGLYMTLLTSFVCQLSHARLSIIVWMDWPESPSVTCRWHARLDVSWIRSVASSTEMAVLSLDSKPLLAESLGELTGVADDSSLRQAKD
jgi:hypothetical protein